MASSLRSPLKRMYQSIDVHSHVYLPRYMDILKSRTKVPYVFTPPSGKDRYVILPNEEAEKSTCRGRPIGEEYWNVQRKLEFMDLHDIDISVLSLANPWLDFLPKDEAISVATMLNQDMQLLCEEAHGRLYGFGVLPQNLQAALDEIERLTQLDHMKGIIMSTTGIGQGLDHQDMIPLYKKLSQHGLLLFLHPHYGVGQEHFQNTGHSLSLALGFTFETTVAVSRLILSGILDQVPSLKLLLAHAGGVLPFLAGRLDSCVSHDPEIRHQLKHPPSHYLKNNMYYDAVVYHTPSLDCLQQFVGYQNILFGTDHPFFPPDSYDALHPQQSLWDSTISNYKIIDKLKSNERDAILRDNAYKIFNISPSATSFTSQSSSSSF